MVIYLQLGLRNPRPNLILQVEYFVKMSFIDLTSHKDNILQLYLDGFSHSELLQWLQVFGILISLRTLERRLREWGVRTQTAVPVTPELISRIDNLYRHIHKSDRQIAATIHAEDGLQVTLNQVKQV